MVARYMGAYLRWAILAPGVPLLQFDSIAMWHSSITGTSFPGYSWAFLLVPWDGGRARHLGADAGSDRAADGRGRAGVTLKIQGEKTDETHSRKEAIDERQGSFGGQ